MTPSASLSGRLLMRRLAVPLILVLAASAAAGASTASRGATPAPAASTVTATTLLVSGRGYGHGVGMNQYGARGRALYGQTARQFLPHYYAGTTLGYVDKATPIRVQVLTDFHASSSKPLPMPAPASTNTS